MKSGDDPWKCMEASYVSLKKLEASKILVGMEGVIFPTGDWLSEQKHYRVASQGCMI